MYRRNTKYTHRLHRIIDDIKYRIPPETMHRFNPGVIVCFEEIWTFTWWRHQMETFSAVLTICAGNLPVTSDFPIQRPATRILMFSVICAWMNAWVNNREAGDLKHHCAHYDVTVMNRVDIIARCQQVADCWHSLKEDKDLLISYRQHLVCWWLGHAGNPASAKMILTYFSDTCW